MMPRSGSVDTVNLTVQICVDRKNHLYNWRHLGKDLDRIHLTTVLYARVKWKRIIIQNQTIFSSQENPPQPGSQIHSYSLILKY